MDDRQRKMGAIKDGYMGIPTPDEWAAKVAVETLCQQGWDVYRIGRDVFYRPRPDMEENMRLHNVVANIRSSL